jgi:hypothetical protein
MHQPFANKILNVDFGALASVNAAGAAFGFVAARQREDHVFVNAVLTIN